MTTYRVAFDGKWQREFEGEPDALVWARSMSAATGRMVWVAKRGFFFPSLVAVFPESEAETGRYLWRVRDGSPGRHPMTPPDPPSRGDRDARDWLGRGECPVCGGGVV